MKKKRFISLLLCICMILSMTLPSYAYDETTSQNQHITNGNDMKAEKEEFGTTLVVSEQPVFDSVKQSNESSDMSIPVDSGKCGDFLTWEFYSNGLLKILGNGEMTSADYVERYAEQILQVSLSDNITSICDSAFKETGITEIEIPESVTDIGRYAFNGCNALKTVVLHKGLETIGEYAFGGTGITEIEIPEGVTFIGRSAFGGCSYLKTVVLHRGLKTIGEYAFQKTQITEIEIPEGVTHIGVAAFSKCKNLTTIILHKGLKRISEYAFQETQITEIEIPEGVTSIGECAFVNCNNLKTVVLHKGLETIGEYAFGGTGITEIEIPEGVTRIYKAAFSGCNNLKTVVLPKGLKIIYDSVFRKTGITEIEIPESVTSIGSYAFEFAALKDVYFYGNPPETIGTSAFNGTSEDLTFYYIEDNYGWKSPTWVDNNGVEYHTDTFVPENNPPILTKISIDIDTSDLTLTEGESFDFAGSIITTANAGLNNIQVNVISADEDGVGIVYHRVEDIGT